MAREQIGELEELVLLAVGSLLDNAYAVTVLQTIVENTDRRLDVTSIHSVLRRLERKGLVNSEMGGATAVRGGRRKKYFSLTRAGRNVLDDTMTVRARLYNQLPKLTFALPKL